MFLHLPGCPEFVEGAFRHARENVDHGVQPILLISFCKCNYFQSECKEGTIKESVHKKHLAYNVKQSQQLTEEVSVGPPVVVLQIVVQIVQEQLLLLLLLDLADHPHVEVHHERGDLARLPVLPQPAGNVEQYRLKEECEAHPLVVRHISPLVLLIVSACHDTRVGHVPAHVQGEGPGNGVGRVDPAIQVEYIVRNIVCVNAVDGIANILSCGDNYRERQQDHRRYAPVKSEHRTVYVNVRDFDEGLQPQKYV